MVPSFFGGNGGLGQLSGTEDIFVPIPVEVCQKEEKEEKPGQAEKKPRPPGTQPKAGGENPAQPTAHWKELYRQTDRSVNYSGQPLVGGGPESPEEPSSHQKQAENDQAL